MSGMRDMSDDAVSPERASATVQSAWLQALGMQTWRLVLVLVVIQSVYVFAPTRPLVHGLTGLHLLLLFPLERFLALRLHLDARLFAALGNGQLGDGEAALARLDQGLHACGLIATPPTPPTPSTVRSLESRMAGTRKLVLRYATVVGLQAVCTVASVALTMAPL